MLRIAQAALDNPVDDADADNIRIAILCDPEGTVCVAVADDGRGFEVDAPHPERFGLVGMNERAERIGAALTLVSTPGMGTEVVARWGPPVS